MWKGPLKDGVTQSLLNRFLECPFSAYLYLILGIEDNSDEKTNLIYGDCGHKGLELLIPTRTDEKPTGDFKNACVGMLERLANLYPHAPSSFRFSLPKMLRLYSLKPFEGDWVTEEVIDEVITVNNTQIRVRGKKDGICHNHPMYGSVLAEHKFKGYTDDEQLREEIKQDLQCNFYMRATGVEWVFYDLIKIPDTQKYGPTPQFAEATEDYIHRIYHGPVGSYNGQYPIYNNKHNWISQKPYYISTEEQEQYWAETISPNIKRLCMWYDWVTQTGFDHENPKFFNELFYKMPIRHFSGRKTEKFKCPYHGYLTGQMNLSDYDEVESYYSELEEL
jgi:hypothetical protein